MSEPTGARTGPLVTALAEGVGADLLEIAADLDAVRGKIEALGDAARAINGLGSECASWADRIVTMATEVRKEAAEVPAKLLGKRVAEITTHVNTELAGRVKAARDAA